MLTIELIFKIRNIKKIKFLKINLKIIFFDE